MARETVLAVLFTQFLAPRKRPTPDIMTRRRSLRELDSQGVPVVLQCQPKAGVNNVFSK